VTPTAGIIITAQSSNGDLHTQQTGKDGSFRFPWLPEAKYILTTPPTINGACRTETLCITGKEIRLNLQPDTSQGEPAEVIGSVRSHSGSYQESLRVKLWPLDLEAAPQATDVIWSEDSEGVISGEFNVPATVGEQYVLSLVKDDILPASFTCTPIQAPSDGLDILFDDTRPHTDLTFRPAAEESSKAVMGFEVAVSWGQGVTWRTSDTSMCVLEGVPCNTPISWSIKAPGRAPVYGETSFNETKTAALIAPALRVGWGEGLKIVHADGSPASGLTVLLDGQDAGLTDSEGTLTLRAHQRPQHLSLRADKHRLFGGSNTLTAIDSIIDRDELGRLLLVLLPRD
jgi:surface antigen